MSKDKNLVLIGYMGSGKTSLGLRLSYRLRLAVEDTDKLIEAREHRAISEIFATDGEAYFRRLETELLEELAESSFRKIYSLGGGTPVQPQNQSLIKDVGTVVYLRILPETVYGRLKNDTTRPLLQCEDPLGRIKEMLSVRGPEYEKCADFIVDVDGKNQNEIVDEIVAYLENSGFRMENV